MRVVGGSFRGRRLAAPHSDAIRPTTDRAREALFNILEHAYPGTIEGARVLDLFAGTGALGIEALSRGAAFCLFVEQAASARALVRQNIESLGLAGRTRIFRRDATHLGPVGTMQPFSLVFADPPYGHGLSEKAIASALAGHWLRKDALIVVEEAEATPFEPPAGIVLHERRTYATTTLTICGLA
ncbi:16S rRNA (guanine(966)-N(2))-methyltransferase RsmD [Chelativorans sp. SCAU2101]|jgi:RNA methyltransferase, RsmD family|uniref:16S rRNA (Guanine(966)-N(2))-methyltransferase RsmD n=1 Tax=Chelativorans petroleitrophicus TaxID=2975484 RepID=A0A9X3B9C1_9HYPH|nr:16S rRNA (guanine(966)-N(2))-methyltransferase RsmD [Chelativorans petroleitrophicus]MCT8990201.1 16S rRNA (guanine(966)-N(2))-methyltransferase RsmD [Chelativorans petroleitrophicus]